MLSIVVTPTSLLEQTITEIGTVSKNTFFIRVDFNYDKNNSLLCEIINIVSKRLIEIYGDIIKIFTKDTKELGDFKVLVSVKKDVKSGKIYKVE